jgi:hypothetical protein
MEWMNRGGRPATPNSQPAANGAPAPVAPAAHGGRPPARPGGPLRWVAVALLFSGTILIVALALFLAFGGKGNGGAQDKHVDTKQMQAVFLNGGQVYFGNIKTLNSQYVRLANIYYLRVNQQVQPDGSSSTNNQDISLVKLGCELHGPQDQMVINQSQVIFWENLKSDGQVAKAVADYVKQNPNGQQCNTQSQDNSSSSNTNNSSTTNKNSTGTTGTTKKP